MTQACCGTCRWWTKQSETRCPDKNNEPVPLGRCSFLPPNAMVVAVPEQSMTVDPATHLARPTMQMRMQPVTVWPQTWEHDGCSGYREREAYEESLESEDAASSGQ